MRAIGCTLQKTKSKWYNQLYLFTDWDFVNFKELCSLVSIRCYKRAITTVQIYCSNVKLMLSFCVFQKSYFLLIA